MSSSDRGTKRKSPEKLIEFFGALEEPDDSEVGSKQRKFNDCIDISTVFKRDFGSSKFNRKPPPNYFFCVRINNQEIIRSVGECQKEIINRNEHISKAAIRIETLHITLMAMHLKDRTHIELLNKVLLESLEEIKLPTNLVLSLKGLSTFRNEVVYVDLEKNESYTNLLKFQKDLVKSIEKWDAFQLYEKNFTPHLTLMKLSKFKGSHKKGIKKISKCAYEQFIESHFGVEMVDELHLCSMHEKQNDGFYKIEATHKFCAMR